MDTPEQISAEYCGLFTIETVTAICHDKKNTLRIESTLFSGSDSGHPNYLSKVTIVAALKTYVANF